MLSRHRQILLICIGLLLFVAAKMKVFGRNVDPVQRIGLFSLQSIQLVIIGFEIALAIWLWSGAFASLGWAMVTLIFTGFAVVSAYRGWMGQTSCGYFGKLTVHPWIAFSVDLVLVTALVFARPDWGSVGQELRQIGARHGETLLAMGGMAFLILAIAAAAGVLQYGSLESALAELRREPVSVEPYLVDLGNCQHRESRDFTIRVVNHTAKPVRIVGGSRCISFTIRKAHFLRECHGSTPGRRCRI